MSDTVFIFGAGVSVQAGGPLMSNFIDIAEDLLQQDAFANKSKHVESIFDLLDELQKIYSKSKLDLNNIEALFGAVEMALTISKLGKYTIEEIKQLKKNLVFTIVKTIEKSIRFPFENSTAKIPSHLGTFSKVIKKFKSASIITFNYDILVDYLLYHHDISFDYGFSRSQKNNLSLLKLHGSTNWALSNKGEIITVPFDKLSNFFTVSENKKNTLIEASNYFLDSVIHNEISESPFIIPPTWNKSYYQTSLSNVWNNAANALGNAKNIYVFGYSLPESDSFFRYLFSIGSMGKTRLRRFWVFDPDNTGGVENRFSTLIGQGSKEKYKYFNKEFNMASLEIFKQIHITKD